MEPNPSCSATSRTGTPCLSSEMACAYDGTNNLTRAYYQNSDGKFALDDTYPIISIQEEVSNIEGKLVYSGKTNTEIGIEAPGLYIVVSGSDVFKYVK